MTTSPTLKAVPNAGDSADVLAEIGSLISCASDDDLESASRRVTVEQAKRHLAAIHRHLESDKVKPVSLSYLHSCLADIRQQLEAPAPSNSPAKQGGFSPNGEPNPF